MSSGKGTLVDDLGVQVILGLLKAASVGDIRPWEAR